MHNNSRLSPLLKPVQSMSHRTCMNRSHSGHCHSGAAFSISEELPQAGQSILRRFRSNVSTSQGVSVPPAGLPLNTRINRAHRHKLAEV